MGIKFGNKQTMSDKMKVATSRVGQNPGVSKGAAKVSGKPKVTLSGTKPGKKQIGAKAKWTF